MKRFVTALLKTSPTLHFASIRVQKRAAVSFQQLQRRYPPSEAAASDVYVPISADTDHKKV